MFEKKNVSEHNFKTQINKSKNHCDDFLYIHISEMKGFGKFFNLGEGGGGGDDSTDSILSSYNEWYFDFNNAIVGVMIPQMI